MIGEKLAILYLVSFHKKKKKPLLAIKKRRDINSEQKPVLFLFLKFRMFYVHEF